MQAVLSSCARNLNFSRLSRFSSKSGDITGSSNVVKQYQAKYALPSGLVVRPATLADYDKVMECASGEFGGRDFLPSYYHRYFKQSNRRSVVIVQESTQKVLFFGSVVVVDGGETAIGNAARVRTDYRGHNLFQFGLGLFHSIATEFRHVKRVLAVTREDQAILEPRFVAGLQRNKLISTNLFVNISAPIGNLTTIAGKIHDFPLNVAAAPYEKASELLSGKSKIKKLLLGGEYTIVDGIPYKVAVPSNFTEPDLYNTRMFIGSESEQPDKASALDSFSFFNLSPTPAGLQIRFYLNAASVDAAMKLLKSSLLGSLDEINQLRNSSETRKLSKESDVIHCGVYFPLSLNQYAMRKRLFEAGFQPSATGTDIYRQYLYQDDVLTALWRDGANSASKS